ACLGQRMGTAHHCVAPTALSCPSEQGKKLFMQSAEEKLIQNRGLLPCLRGTVRDDINALGIAEKVPVPVCPAVSCASSPCPSLWPSTMAREKLQNDVFDRVNVCNMLLYELRQRDRALEELQRQLQHLTEEPSLMQMIRQLENNIEKTLMKVRTGQKVTTLYLAVRDVLKKVSSPSASYRSMYQGTHYQFLMERNLRDHSLAAQKERIDKIRLKDASERHRRAVSWWRPGQVGTRGPEALLGWGMSAKLEATKSQIEHQAQVTAEVEKVKSAVQCSRLWDIAGKLLAQQKSTVDLQQHIKECEEKKVVLKDKLKELELKQAELKFHQPPMWVNLVSSRKLEEELKINLQQEEARLEQMQAQMLKNQELLLMFENGIDNLFIRLYGITVPDQVLTLCRESWEMPCLLQTFVKVRNFLEKTTKEEPQNLRISLEDIDAFDFADKDHGHVLTREEIKKQGLRIIESKMKSGKKKQQSFPKGF
uniref:Uncharacterized protein n=1 Tax=Nothoprocta perdicaria TaxID=30464 RepID=A0A8C7E9Q4_NOTPE